MPDAFQLIAEKSVIVKLRTYWVQEQMSDLALRKIKSRIRNYYILTRSSGTRIV